MKKKLLTLLRRIFGWGMLLALAAGALCFLGYVLAFLIGGQTAALICRCIYERIIPALVYGVNALVLLGVVAMYLAGEKALTVETQSDEP